MAELFKNIYTKDLFNDFTNAVKKLSPTFNSNAFKKDIFTKEWENMELKQRMRHTTLTLGKHLPNNFKANANLLTDIIPLLDQNEAHRLAYIFLPDFIEIYGINDFDLSMKAFEKITTFISCEFAVRPFIINDQDRMLKQMLQWSKNENPFVRRLATEGCRPRLPWAMALPTLKKDPSPILPILENLRTDDTDFVRLSVANNLNDISKDNPELIIKIAKAWLGKTKETDALIKHACRTLLKQGLPEVMTLFGFGSIEHIAFNNFKVVTPEVKIGGYLEFQFQLVNKSNAKSKIRLEYAVYYQKANGTLSKKVYKISEKVYAPNSETMINRKQPFKLITTRKFHLGLHQVAVIVNGTEFEKIDFNLSK
ncbi:DNA alkylation repair protein [Saccharicrinis aurantiacus]|uniref:DNA alkylation repair protein n=1 Tax=Saccharicrinis aurantiacus TaxID=1849719 RepID=UPI00248FE56E|nr:DNA alkylation repair protein [Saccharicrinis aurantiacus]